MSTKIEKLPATKKSPPGKAKVNSVFSHCPRLGLSENNVNTGRLPSMEQPAHNHGASSGFIVNSSFIRHRWGTSLLFRAKLFIDVDFA